MTATLGVVVFARFDSGRLPGKALLDLDGRPLLEHVVGRARRIHDAGDTIVATTDRPVDDPIASWAADHDVPVHRGALDPLDRSRTAACERSLDAVVRISGDSPLLDPTVGDRVVQRFRDGDVELATNVFPRSWPRGCSVEVIATALLDRLDRVASTSDREHVTRWCYEHPDDVVIGNVTTSPTMGGSIAVDEPDDLERARWILRTLDDRADTAPVEDVAALAREWDARRSAP